LEYMYLILTLPSLSHSDLALVPVAMVDSVDFERYWGSVGLC
jgi:hypothetical protein